MATEEQRGYQDAIHQVQKALERRKHHLVEHDSEEAPKTARSENEIRISEVDHVIEILRSLHR